MTKYRNVLSGLEHPVFTDNVIEAKEMWSDSEGCNVVYEDSSFRKKPARVVQLYKIFANRVAINRKKKLDNPKG